jgi:hypothetical protein
MELALIRRPTVLLAAALGISLCFALPQRASAAPGVARISDMQGSVAVQRGDSNQAVAATVNAPVLGADYITTGDNSRAQVDLDGASSVRLGSGVQMRFSNLDQGSRRMQLAQGPVDLRVFRANDLATQIDTPSISVRPREPGSYRVNVTPDGRTWVVVRSGSADVITPQGRRTIGPGATLMAAGSASNPSLSTEGAVADDAFDTWNGQRDQHWQAAAPSDTYVDRNIVGVDDLQQYGSWQDDPAYGQVWVPNAEPASWSPYQNGRWVWEDGYGWTWVASEPWGWAPYHYGSWYRSSYGWAWYPPGPAVVAPVWQPALVAFIGFGGGSGISLALNLGDPGYNVGWIPLAPFEPYYPWYGNGGYGGYGGYGSYRGYGYNNQVTMINNPGIYRNYRYGVTAVSGQQFAAGQFGHSQRYSAGQMRNVRGFRGAVPLAPTAANLRFGSGNVSRQLQVAPKVAGMRFAGNASVARRTPFTQTRTALASGIGHARVQTVAARFTTPTTPTAIHAAAARSTAARMTAARVPARPNVARSAVRTNLAPNGARPNVAHAPAKTTTNAAWQRFGNQRGVQVAPRGVAAKTTAVRGKTTANVKTAPRTFGTTANVRKVQNTAPRAHVATAPRTKAAPVVHARTAPVARTYSAPARTTRAAPVARTYSAPVRTTHAAPVARTYTAPVRTTRAAPVARTYSAPVRTTRAAPVARTYSAPVRTTRAAPVARTYSAPARQAPARQAPPARGGPARNQQHPPR